MKRVLIPLAPGFEEIEALTVVDILRRAGAEVINRRHLGGDNNRQERHQGRTRRHRGGGVRLRLRHGGAPRGRGGYGKPQERRTDSENRKGLRLPGKLVAAICAAPTVLSAVGLVKGRSITSHPSVRGDLPGANVTDERVVRDGNLVTSQGPGTALEFAFTLVETLFGPEKVAEVNEGVLARL